MVRRMMSRRTTTLKPARQIPQRIIRRFSIGSSARHFRWRCSCRTRLSNRIGMSRTWRKNERDKQLACRVHGVIGLFYVADEGEDFLCVRPKVLGELVLDWFAYLRKAAFVDVLDDLDAHFLEFCQRFVFKL